MTSLNRTCDVRPNITGSTKLTNGSTQASAFGSTLDETGAIVRGNHIATSKSFVISNGKYDDLYELKVDASIGNPLYSGKGVQPLAIRSFAIIKS